MPRGAYQGDRLVLAGLPKGSGRGQRGHGDSGGRHHYSPSEWTSRASSTLGKVVIPFKRSGEMTGTEKKFKNASQAARRKQGTTAEERHKSCQEKMAKRLARKATAKATASFEVGKKRGIGHRQQATVLKKPNKEPFRRPQSSKSAHKKAVPKKAPAECPRAPNITTAQGVDGSHTTVKRIEELSDAEKTAFHLEVFHGIDVINLD